MSDQDSDPTRGESAAVEALSFEDALAQLEILVESMEGGDIPLAELVEAYSRGNALLKHCQAKLRHAELKIEKLTAPGDGEGAFEPHQVDN